MATNNKPLTLLEAVDEAGAWNRSDIRTMEEITPDLPMLKARAKVLRAANRQAREVKLALKILSDIFADEDSTNDQEHDATVDLMTALGWEPKD